MFSVLTATREKITEISTMSRWKVMCEPHLEPRGCMIVIFHQGRDDEIRRDLEKSKADIDKAIQDLKVGITFSL